MAEEGNERASSGLSIDRILLLIALISGASSGYLGISATQLTEEAATDRYFGREGHALEVRVDYLEREIGQLREDVRQLPPDYLLRDVAELEAQVQVLRERVSESHQ